MDNRPKVDKIAQSLAFEVEATPQDNGLEITSTSKITPLNFKIRIRKKNEAVVQKGILSVPKLNVPERIRLISSDQTIMSFDMLMEAVINKKYSRKATRRFFGGCFKNGCDQDDSPYKKKISKSKLYGEDITSRSAGVINNSILVAKNNDQLNSSPKQPNKKTQHDYFGKCKPGGCLDPPFDEDKYSYEPNKEQILFDNSKNYNILKIKKNDGLNSIIDRLSIEKSSDRVQNKSSVLSILSLYQAQFLNNSLDSKYSDSIITYPPTLSSSEILAEKYINEKNRINGDKSKKSFNEFYETYFIPSKTTKKYINKKASIISHTNKRFNDPTTLNNKIQKEIEGNPIEFIKPYPNENKTQQIVISKVNQNYIDQPEKEHLYEDTTELISEALYEPLVEPKNIISPTLDLKSDKIIIDNQTDNKITQNEVIANDNNSYISINRKSGSKMISSNFTDQVQDNYNFQTNSKDLGKIYENITNSTREINNNNNSNEAFINDKIHLKHSKLSQIAIEKRNITASKCEIPKINNTNKINSLYTNNIKSESVILLKNSSSKKSILPDYTVDNNTILENILSDINYSVSAVIEVNQHDTDQLKTEHLYKNTTTKFISKALYGLQTEPDNNKSLKSDKIITNDQANNYNITQNKSIVNNNNSYVSTDESQKTSSKITDQIQDNYSIQINNKEVENIYEKPIDTDITKERNKKYNDINKSLTNNITHSKDLQSLEFVTKQQKTTISTRKVQEIDDTNKNSSLYINNIKAEYDITLKKSLSEIYSTNLIPTNHTTTINENTVPDNTLSNTNHFISVLNEVNQSDIYRAKTEHLYEVRTTEPLEQFENIISPLKSSKITTDDQTDNYNITENNLFVYKNNNSYISMDIKIDNPETLSNITDQLRDNYSIQINNEKLEKQIKNIGNIDASKKINLNNKISNDTLTNDKLPLKGSKSLESIIVHRNSIVTKYDSQEINYINKITSLYTSNIKSESNITLEISIGAISNTQLIPTNYRTTINENIILSNTLSNVKNSDQTNSERRLTEANKNITTEKTTAIKSSKLSSKDSLNYDFKKHVVDTNNKYIVKNTNIQRQQHKDTNDSVQAKTKNTCLNNINKITTNFNESIRNELLDTLDTNNKENCEESNSAIYTYKRDINIQKNDKSNVEISNKNSKIIKYETSKKISEEPKIDDKSTLSDFKQECVNPTISTGIVTVNSYKESQIKEQTSFIADDVKSENIINKCFISSLSASHIKEEIQNESPGICLNLAFQSYPGKNGNKTIKTLDASRPLVREPDDSITIIKSEMKPDSKEIKIPIDSENYMFIQLKKDQPHLTQKNKSTFTKQTQDVSAMELNNNIESLQKTLAILYELQLVPLQNVIKSLKEEIDELAKQQIWLKENLQIKKNKPIKLININKRCGCFKRYGNI